MGVITRLRPIDDIVAQLRPGDPIAVISCNNCVRVSGAGGEGVWEDFCRKLRERGIRIEQQVLITNPCSRGYFENLKIAPIVKTVVMMACRGAQSGFHSLYDDIQLVPATETMGLFVASAKDGVVKLMLPFEGYEHLQGREFPIGKVGPEPFAENRLQMEH